ncbi:MAG: hypothetical protein CMF61_00765 [Magnetococcales bacterium]|nr:hypothetical protein [Magnetococcales bacterium]
MSQSFIFLRHGQTDWNVQKIKQGHTDIPLNSIGEQQALDACEKLKSHHITRIVSSPLTRAVKTAEAVAIHKDINITIETQLIERCFGNLEGQPATISDLEMQANDSVEKWENVKQRSESLLQYITNEPNETFLFVGHGAFFRALYEHLTDGHFVAENATPYLFTFHEGQWEISTI